MTRIPKAKVPDPVRYKEGNSSGNVLLRQALLKVWGDRCYLCTTPVTFVGTEIDHILPKTLTAVKLGELKAQLLNPVQARASDLNMAHNLAPICRKCNSDKSDTTFSGVPALAVWLHKA